MRDDIRGEHDHDRSPKGKAMSGKPDPKGHAQNKKETYPKILLPSDTSRLILKRQLVLRV